MPGRVVDIAADVAAIFDQVQRSTANHQKNYVAAYKLHSRQTLDRHGNRDDRGANEFAEAFLFAILKVLPTKKGATAADRVVKFVAGYFQYLNERDSEDEGADQDGLDTTTLASRFIDKILRSLLGGFKAKDKVVRYRVVDFVAGMVEQLGTIDEHTYSDLREHLLDRLHDKEATIRVKVIISLSKLAEAEDLEELKKAGRQSIPELLLEVITADPAPEVRRIAAVNIPLDPLTDDLKAALFSRIRDEDASVRKIMYSHVFEKEAHDDGAFPPRSLTIANREYIVRSGLGDREPAVRSAAASMLGVWYDRLSTVKAEEDLVSQLQEVDISATREKPAPREQEQREKTIENLTQFLSLFDLHQQELEADGETQRGKVAADALKSLLTTRKGLEREIYFGDAYFDKLTPERTFLVRVFVEHCANGRNELLEDCGIPVVTRCAFLAQEWFSKVISNDDDITLKAEVRDELREARELIVGELLSFAVHLDYGDETGRRKMHLVIQNMLGHENTPSSLLTRCLDVLRKLTTDERDLIRQVVEMISNLRDEPDEDAGDRTMDSIDSSQQTPRKQPVRKDLTPQQQQAADAIDLRCLALSIALLERLDGTFEDNSTLQGVFQDLIMPSVGRADSNLQLQGLVGFGLSCLVTPNLAAKFLPALLDQSTKTVSDDTRMTIFKIVFDVLLGQPNLKHDVKGQSQEFLVKKFQEECDKKGNCHPETLALLSLGLSKLVLHSLVDDPKMVMEHLFRAYFSPYNRENQRLLQCLTYFINMYGRCAASNQQIMRELFTKVLKETAEMYRDFEDDEDDVGNLDLANVTGMWVECTNPLELMDTPGLSSEPKAEDMMVQFALAEDVLRLILREKNMHKDQRKLLCQMLGKLYIPDEVADTDRVYTLRLLISHVNLYRPVKDATANNALKKFDAKIGKQFEKQLGGFSEEDYRKMEQLKDLFEFLDDVIPDDDEEDAPKKGRKRRSDSIMSTTDDDTASVASSRRTRAKPKSKKRRLSTSDDEDSDSDRDTVRGTPPPPRRRMPQRSAATKKKPQVIVISDDEPEDDNNGESSSDDDQFHASRRRGAGKKKRRESEEARLDADINAMLDEGPSVSTVGHDSIMDSDDDDVEEVNDLLVDDDE
ncbi:Peptidase A1 domain-containing protein [Mycena indigotica]|uniref:Peptidase A1 domain-containing protein n=1 Tax=Mycena indigotica TaxID=2126181 RepID=A0A8H6WBS0_9AGAR|nr:Peptidase A1 domain-containing protein [Mycena indigotica]KAF7312107.1 Peptidase A1 domain-containing protein [Mycena indigotica]